MRNYIASRMANDIITPTDYIENAQPGRQVTLRLSGDCHDYLKAVAYLSGKSPAEVVEEMLWEHLPSYRLKILDRRKAVLELMSLAGMKSIRQLPDPDTKEKGAKKKGAK